MQSKLSKLKADIERLSNNKADPWAVKDAIDEFAVRQKKVLDKYPEALKFIEDAYRKLANDVSLNLEQVNGRSFLELDDLANINVLASHSHKRCVYAIENTTWFVVEQILSQSSVDRDRCTLALEFWIAVMKRSFDMGDYQAAVAIFGALNEPSITRLKSAYAGVSPQAMLILNKIEEMITKSSLLIENRIQAIIPPFNYFSLHITHIKDPLGGLLSDLLGKLLNNLQKSNDDVDPKIIDQINAINSNLKNYSEKSDLLNDLLNKLQKSDLDVDLNIVNQINAINLNLKKYTDQIEDMQEKLKNNAKHGKKSKLHYFDYQDLTKDKSENNNELREQLTKISLRVEPAHTQIQRPTVLKKIPHLILDEQAKVNLNKKIQIRLEQANINKKITNINCDIAGLMAELEKYSTTQSDSHKDRLRKAKIDGVRNQLHDLELYVKTKAAHGCVPNVQKLLSSLQEIENDANMHFQVSNKLIVRLLSLSVTLKHKVIQLKDLLEKEYKLESTRAYLEKQYQDILLHESILALSTSSRTEPHIQVSLDNQELISSLPSSEQELETGGGEESVCGLVAFKRIKSLSSELSKSHMGLFNHPDRDDSMLESIQVLNLDVHRVNSI